MAKGKVTTSSSSKVEKIRPALTPEARENQMIALAMNLVEQRLLDGTASSQETTHFLKLGSMKAKLEKERLENENKLLAAKTNAIEKEGDSNERYAEVLKAIREYQGRDDHEDY